MNWPYGTVVRCKMDGSRMPKTHDEAVHYTTARVLVIEDRGVPSFTGLSLVDTPLMRLGGIAAAWNRKHWEPVDE